MKKNSGQFKAMGLAIAAMGTAALLTFKKMVKQFVDTGDMIHKMSIRTGFSAVTLSELAYAADISGANIEMLEKGVKKMSKTIVDASYGLETYLRVFRGLGLDIKDLMKLTPEEQFLKIGAAIAAMESQTLKTAAAVDVFGRAGTMLLPLFAEGEEGMAKLREEAHRLGWIFDAEAAAKAAKLKDAQTALAGSVKGLSIAILTDLIPVITEVTKGFTDWFVTSREGATDWTQAILGFFRIIGKGVQALMLAWHGLGAVIFTTAAMVVKSIKFQIDALLLPIRLLAKLPGFGILAKKMLKMVGEHTAILTVISEGYNETAEEQVKKIENIVLGFESFFTMLDKVSKKVEKTGEEAGKGLVDPIRTNSEEVVNLVSKMVDEIFEAAHNEFEVRTRMARRTYEERKAFLDKEEAADSAYVVAKEAYTAELNEIEEDRTKKIKEGWKERGKAVTAGLLKWRAEQKKYQSFSAELTDIISKHALSERNYKLEQNDIWYKARAQTYWDTYGDSKQFYALMEELDDAYEARRRGILAETPAAWEVTFANILGAAAMFTSALSGLFNQITENQIANIEKEYEARKAAIENSLMTEKSKADAMERLDKATEKKRKKAQRSAAKRTKAVSLMEAIVNTAAAVVQAMKAPFPLNLILPIIIGAMGAVQIALIAAQPLPSFQRGGRIEEAGIVGEAGPELFIPERPGMIVPLREGAGMGALRPIYVTIAPTYQITAVDEIGVRDFMRERGLPAIVEAVKVGIMKPELQDALRIK